MKPLDHFLLFVVRYGLHVVLFLPFIVVLTYLYPWVSGKVWVLQIAVELLLPLWVLLAMRRKEFRPTKGPLLYAILAYFAVATLSAFFGEHTHRSFWAKPDRLTGLFFQYHLIGLFLMASTVWREKLGRVIAISVSVATITALHAIHQTLFGASDVEVGGGRGMAAFGNPSYLGQYLVPHLFLSALLIRRSLANGWRWVWMTSAILMLIGLFTTQSKGSFVGAFLGALVAVVIAAWKGKRGTGTRKTALVGLGALALVVVGYLAANKIPATADWLYRHRFAMQYIRETSGSRGLLIESSATAIKTHPLLGWGPENFESAFYLNYDPYTLRYSEYETRQDRPHNMLLELLVNLGIVGFIAYFAVLASAWKMAVRGEGSRLFDGGVLTVAALSQVATNIFLFETPMSYVTLYLMLSFIAAHAVETPEEGSDEISQGAIPAAIAVAALTIWAFSYGVVGTMKAAKITSYIIIEMQGRELPPADWVRGKIEELDEVKTPYHERDIRAIISHITRGRGGHQSGEYNEILRKLAVVMDAYTDKNDNKKDFVHALVTASSYLSINGRTPEEEAILRKHIARMYELSLRRQEVHWIDGQAKLEAGDKAGGEERFKAALALDERIVEARAELAGYQLMHIGVPQTVETLKPLAGAMPPQGSPALDRATLVLVNNNRYQELYDLYVATKRENVGTFTWTVIGALASMTLGDVDRGLTIAQEAKSLYPDRAALVDDLVKQQLQMMGKLPPDAPAPAPVPAPAPTGRGPLNTF